MLLGGVKFILIWRVKELSHKSGSDFHVLVQKLSLTAPEQIRKRLSRARPEAVVDGSRSCRMPADE